MAVTSAAVDSTARSGSTGTTSTITGCTYGTAFAGRVICQMIATNTGNPPTSATINGVAATITGTFAGAQNYILSAIVPTGTSGSTVCHFASSDRAFSEGIIALTGAANATPSDTMDVFGTSTGTIDVGAGGSIVAFAVTGTAGTWTGVTSKIALPSSASFVGTFDNSGGAISGRTISYSTVGTSIVAAAFDAAGSIISVSVAESGSLSDAVGALAVLLASVAEVATALDSNSATAQLAASLAETASLADLVGGGVLFTAAVAEAASAADTVNGIGIFPASIAEAASSSDLFSNTAVLGAIIAETILTADSQGATAAFLASIVEAASAIDSPSAGLTTSAAVAETTNAADSLSAGTTTAATIQEAASATDAVSAVNHATASVQESSPLIDAESTTAVLSASVPEQMNAEDAVAASSGPPPIGGKLPANLRFLSDLGSPPRQEI